ASAGLRKASASVTSVWPARSRSSASTGLTPSAAESAATWPGGGGECIQRMVTTCAQARASRAAAGPSPRWETGRLRTVDYAPGRAGVLLGVRLGADGLGHGDLGTDVPVVNGLGVVALFDVVAVALVPPVEDRAGDEERREGADDDTDDQRDGDVVDF